MAIGQNRNVALILKHFTCMWILTVLGIIAGTLLPFSVVTPLSIICFVLLLITAFVRTIRLANFILYTIPFLMGIMLFWITHFFIEVLGAGLVITVSISTVVIFIILALLGLNMSADISDWGTYLFATLIVVVVFSIIFLFVPIHNTIGLVFAAICVFLFALYTVYDFNLIRHKHVKDEDVVRMASSLYLNFINMFTNILELIWRIKE